MSTISDLLPPSIRARLREGEYTTTVNGAQHRVAVTDGDTLRDVADLWAVVDGQYRDTDSTASDALKTMLGHLEGGAPLSDGEWAILNRLRTKYAVQLATFRASKDADTEGFVPRPAPGRGRIIESRNAAQTLAGLTRLVEQQQYGGTPSTTKLDKAGTTAHLLDSVLHDVAHTRQHIARIMDPDVKKDPASVRFNAEHALNHAESALDHGHKLDNHLSANASDPKVHVTERTAINEMRALQESMRVARAVALHVLREGNPRVPPGLRQAPLVTKPGDTAPSKQCGTCTMDDHGCCWGYDGLPVQPDWVCNEWALEPDWKAQMAGFDLVGMALAGTTVGDMAEYSDGQARGADGKWSGGDGGKSSGSKSGKDAAPSLSKGQAKALVKMFGTGILRGEGPGTSGPVAGTPGLDLKGLHAFAFSEAQPREDSGKFFRGSRPYDPLLVNADGAHAAEAASRLVAEGRIRVLGQADASKQATDDIVRRVGAAANVRTLAVKGNPYTQLTAVHEASATTEETVAADPGHPAVDKPTMCVDFDGVLHQGSHGMPGTVEGTVTDGAQVAMKQLADRYRVVVLTARQDFAAVRRWLAENGISEYVDQVTNVKPGALGYIDDRAIHFNGNWKDVLAAADPTKATDQLVKVRRTYEATALLLPSAQQALRGRPR